MTQHVKAGTCEGYLFFYAEQGTNKLWDALVTNCSPNIQGLPPDCLVGVSSSGKLDPVVASMECVCCIGAQCGRACHPVKLDGGGGVTCASYSSDFSSPPTDPQTDPTCDCTGF